MDKIQSQKQWIKNIILSNNDKKIFIIVTNIIFALIYFIISNASLKLATINTNVTPIWPSTGLSIAILILFGRKYTYSIFIGAFCANIMTPGPALNAFIIALGNTAEAFLGHFIYLKINQHKNKLANLTELIGLTTSSLIAPIFSASIGVLSLSFFKLAPKDMRLTIWLTWWTADALGALLLIPLLLNMANKEFLNLWVEIKLNKQKSAFIFLFSVMSLVATYFILINTTSLKYFFLLFPFLIIFSLIKNKFYLYLFSFILCAETILITISGKGPFNLSTFNQNLINLEIFIVAICITTLALASFNQLKFIKQIRILLLCGWLFWGFVFFSIQRNHEISDANKFNFETSDIEKIINEKMNDYIQILKSGQALYLASKDVDPSEWHDFVEALNISKAYDGMNGMGVVFKVENDQLSKYIEKFKRKIDRNFTVQKVPSNLGDNLTRSKDHIIITYIEPYEKNKIARGLDLGTEFNRRSAAEKSLLSGIPTITDRIKLAQDDKKRLGFLLFVPVYKKNFPLRNPEERKAAFSHWIYAPFISEKFLDSVFKNIKNTNLVSQIYDGPSQNNDQLVYSYNQDLINPNAPTIFRKIQLADKTFYIKWSKSINSARSHDFLSTWIGLIGALSVVIIVLFIINIQELEDKSKQIANELHQVFLDSQLIVKEQEAKIIESSRMATLGEMASGIAHEINNPLTIISVRSLHIKRFLTSIHNDEKEKILDHIQKIEKTIGRIDKIIKGLRSLSRDATNDQMRNISIDTIVEETLSLCQERFRIANINLKVEVNYHGDLLCRDTQISQVLLNLLNNSYDAVQEYHDKWVVLTIEKRNDFLEITITDNGKGIPKEIQQKILHPFFTTKEIGKGTGLGLSISKGIVESHGGTLQIDSEYFHTRFIIRLPISTVV